MNKGITIRIGNTTTNLLGVLFVALKLTGYIDWSWFWVTAPFWIPFAIIFGIFGFALVMKVLAVILK